MGKIKVIDNFAKFAKISDRVMGLAVERMAGDIKQVATIRVPFKSGDLQKSSEVRKKGELHFQVWFDKEYASYQERGQRADGSKVVRKYTTPSTGRNFLKNAGTQIAKDTKNYLKQAVSQIRI